MPLAPLTTLELGGRARHLALARDDDAIVEALRWADARKLPVLLLGGGSNLVVADAGFPGLVVQVASRGRRFEPAGGEVALTAAAGEPWDAARRRHRRGVSSPASNVSPASLDWWARRRSRTWAPTARRSPRPSAPCASSSAAPGAFRDLAPADCGFSYRDSAFKRDPVDSRSSPSPSRSVPAARPACATASSPARSPTRDRPTLADARQRGARPAPHQIDGARARRPEPSQRRILLHQPGAARRRGGGRRRRARSPRAPPRPRMTCRAGPAPRARSSCPRAGSSSGPASRRDSAAAPWAFRPPTRWRWSTTAAARPPG